MHVHDSTIPKNFIAVHMHTVSVFNNYFCPVLKLFSCIARLGNPKAAAQLVTVKHSVV